ncbi:MAG TPA: histidine kinase dimerization/phospho-acceptor domain-containing protein, partial [Polyangiaceae bacterium]|nr:histidine kinase dimerization/phospho-acceptor domain-containing protein [Polyangiaceae bacterium]
MLAVSAADTGRRRLELLRGVDLELAKRGDVRDRLSNALSLLVREICQQIVFDLYEADGKHSLLTAFADPELECLAHEVGRRYPLEAFPSATAAANSAPESGVAMSGPASAEAPPNDVSRPEVMLREVSDSLLGAVARDAEHLSLLRRFNATELCIVLVRGQRRVQGVLLLATDQGRRFDALDRTFIELLAERIAAHLGAAYWDALLTPQPLPGYVRAGSPALERDRNTDPLRAILESGLIGTLEWDGNGVIIDVNAALVRLSRRSREALLSGEFRLQHLLAPEDSDDEGLVSAPVVLERELLAPDGTRVPVLFGRVPWLGRHRHGIGFVVDVTEQQRRAEFEEMLLGIVSHDLRNPLGVVTMAASLLLAQNLTDTQRRLAHRIESAGRKSARLISDLLDFTIARRTGISLAPEPKDLHSVVAQAVDDLQANWPERCIVHERFGDAISQLDQARVEQMAANLIGNALQHGTPGSVVRVETRGDESNVSLSVTNQGRPIPEDLMHQLFSPMRRGGNAGHR